MKRLWVPAVISCFLSIHSIAGELAKPESILGTKEFCISDGSSFFIFSPDKKFRLEPIGLGGRTIEGTWTQDSAGMLHVAGRWSWINGISDTEDFREMDMIIGSLKGEPRELTSAIDGSKTHPIYDCYFSIERVEKKKG